MKTRYSWLVTMASLLFAFTTQTKAQQQTFPALGMFIGNPDDTSPTKEAAFEAAVLNSEAVFGQRANTWDYFSPDYNDSFTGTNGWVNNAGWGSGSLKLACSATHLDHVYTPIVSVGLNDKPDAGNELNMLNAVASGTYDSVYQTCILDYKNAGFATIYLRIGWEQNGNWEPWQVNSGTAMAAAYSAAWKHVANLAHNLNPTYPITGMNIKTVWCTSETNIYDAGVTIQTYPIDSGSAAGGPGDQYVDIIAPDTYSNVENNEDQSNGHPGWFFSWDTRQDIQSGSTWAADPVNRIHYWDYPEASNQYNETAGWGMPMAISMALTHNKPLGISECGTVAGTTSGSSGPADDGVFPLYLANRLSSAAAQGLQIEFVDVWTTNSGNGNFYFWDGNHPNEEAAWKEFVYTMAAAANPEAEVPAGIGPTFANYALGVVGTVASGTTISTGTYTLYGGGTGYISSGTADNFNFVAQSTLLNTTDNSVVMKVDSATIATAQTGLMLRQGMNVSDTYAALYISNGQLIFQSRVATGAPAVMNYSQTVATPIWLKLAQDGNVVTGYESSDGMTWTYAGAQTLPPVANTSTYTGLALSSGNSSGTNQAATVSFINQPNYNVLTVSSGSNVILTGTWSQSTTSPGYLGSYYLTDNNTNKGGSTVAFYPTIPVTGNYDVYTLWTSGTNRSDSVPISINGVAQTPLNEQISGTVWNFVGNSSFTSGTSGSIVVSNAGTTGYVIANAVMVVNSGPGTIILDNAASAGISSVGTWPASTFESGYYGTNYQYSDNTTAGQSFTFAPDVAVSGTYNVYARWTASSNRSAAASVTINSGTGQSAIHVNEQVDNNIWVLLGTYPFTAGTGGSVVFNTDGTGNSGGTENVIVVDAVELIKQ